MAEHPVKAASGTAGEYNTFSLCAFHLCNSRLAGARPPPTHQSSSAVVSCVRPWDCGHASSRDHRSRAQPRECRTAAGGKIFSTGVVLSLLRSRLAGALVPPEVRGRRSQLAELRCAATAGAEIRGRARPRTTVTGLGCGMQREYGRSSTAVGSAPAGGGGAGTRLRPLEV